MNCESPQTVPMGASLEASDGGVSRKSENPGNTSKVKVKFWLKCAYPEHNLFVDGIKNPLAYRFTIRRLSVAYKT